jgi:predicted DNA-binding transcriptional regulator AlpA
MRRSDRRNVSERHPTGCNPKKATAASLKALFGQRFDEASEEAMTVTNRKGRKVGPHDQWALTTDVWNAPLWNRTQVLLAYGGKSVSWLYSEMAAGRLPRPRRIGRNSVAWVSAEVRADIDAKIAAGPVELTAKPRVYKSRTAASRAEA